MAKKIEIPGPTLILSDEDKAQIEAEKRSRGIVAGAVVTASALEQMTADEIDADLIEMCGHAECPACSVHLSNGVSDFDGMEERHGSQREALKHQKHEWACLGCGAEWGAEIKPAGRSAGKAKSAPSRHYLERSTVEGAVGIVWALCAEMPDAGRKEVIAAAVEKGVAFNTARTQYQKWFKAQKTTKGLANG